MIIVLTNMIPTKKLRIVIITLLIITIRKVMQIMIGSISMLITKILIMIIILIIIIAIIIKK